MKFKKILVIPIALLSASVFFTHHVDAHVVVRPKTVGVASRETFVINVPTEKDVPTTQVSLQIPAGLQSVRPHVAEGWDIEIVRDDASDTITEIIWSNGSIPADQMDVLMFNAQAPLEEGELVWKAYQTYADGEVVAWDASPAMLDEYEQHNGEEAGDDAPNPYSSTEVVDDVSDDTDQGIADEEGSQSLLWVGVVAALALSGYTLAKHKS